MAALGLGCRPQAFVSCGERARSVVVRRLLIEAASLSAERRRSVLALR